MYRHVFIGVCRLLGWLLLLLSPRLLLLTFRLRLLSLMLLVGGMHQGGGSHGQGGGHNNGDSLHIIYFKLEEGGSHEQREVAILKGFLLYSL